MSDATRTKFRSSVVKRPPTGIPVSRGKENARPSSAASRRGSTASTKASTKAGTNEKEAVCRTRIPVTVVSKKTPFRIHCDEKNVPNKRESRSIVDDGGSNEPTQIPLNRDTGYANHAFRDTSTVKKTLFEIYRDEKSVYGKRESPSIVDDGGSNEPTQIPLNRDTFVSKKTFEIHRDEKNVPDKCEFPAIVDVDGDSDGSKKASRLAVNRGTGYGNYAFGHTVVAKKTPIETRFDEENVLGKRESPAIDDDDDDDDHEHDNDGGTEKVSRDGRRTDKKQSLSRIPRRPRSCTVLPSKDSHKWLTPGRRGLRVIGVETLNSKIVSEVNGLLAKENANSVIPKAQDAATPRVGWSYVPAQSESTGRKKVSWAHRRGSVSSNATEWEPQSYDLLYHYEYHDDLPVVELQREEQSVCLSANFLQRSINAEQRRLVVTFMLRIGAHARYSSFAVYQAVKLFDAVLDRFPLNAWSMQLSALASLWIALKKQQHYRKIPSAAKMVSLAKDLYQGREDLLIEYEKKILLAFNFNVTFADPFTLYNYHLLNCRRCIDVPEETVSFLRYSGNYLIDVTLLDEYFCRHGASLLALTAAELALGLALDALQPEARPRWLFWRGMLFAHLPCLNERYMAKDIDRSRVTLLRRLLISGKKNYGFEVVYNKHSRGRYGRISERLLERAGRVSSTESLFDP